MQKLSVSGRNFVDENNNPMIIKGSQFALAFYRENYSTLKDLLGERAENFFSFGGEAWVNDADLQFLRNMGLNSLRVRFSWDEIMTNGEIDEFVLMRYTHLLSKCRQHDVYIILAMTPPGGWGKSSELWGNSANKALFYQTWSVIAQYTRNGPVVLGYDLQNEPYPPTKEEYIEVCNDAKDAIRFWSNKPIFYAFPFGGIDMPDVSLTEQSAEIYDPQGVVTAHFYWPTLFTHQYDPGSTYPSPDLSKEDVEHVFSRRLDNYTESHELPFYLGEFGARGVCPGESEGTWVGDVKDIIESRNMSWNHFSFKHAGNPDKSFGLLTSPINVNDYLRPLVMNQSHYFGPEDFECLKFNQFEQNSHLIEAL